MIKYITVFITSLAVLISIVGCEPARPKSVEPAKVEPQKVEPAEAEPPEIETARVEPAKVEPPKIEPPKVETTKVEPVKAETPKIEHPKAETQKAEIPKIESPKVESTRAEPQKSEPSKPKPSKAEPSKAEPAKTEPSKTEPQKAKPRSAADFHDKCAEIFNKFVDGKGMVDYKALNLKRQVLKALLNEFKELDPKQYSRWSKEDKIAFWINAYNIQMLKIIVDNYPIKSFRMLRVFPGWGPNSIKHIGKRIGGIHNQKFIVMEEEFTLIEVDRKIFRKQFSEPRVFLALSRASLSGPPLRNEPYYGKKLYKQLDNQVKKFLSRPLAFKIDREKRIVYLSPIFEPSMYGKEFIKKYGTDKKFKDQNPTTRAVLNFITNYLSKQDVGFLEVENYSVKSISYDWRIDEQH